MADGLIGAAPVGQPGAVSGQGAAGIGAGVQSPSASPAGTVPQEQGQPQVNYVTSEQLNAAVERIERLVQSSTDKSYSRVRKMIASMQQAGIQNPTEAQARAMLELQEQGRSESQQETSEAQTVKSAAASAEAEAWIKANGGDVTKEFWNDIYDAAQEAGVGIITREDPEYNRFFTDENGQPKSFAKTRQFVRAFEQAFEAKKQRLGQQGANSGNPAAAPALGGTGAKSSFHDPKTTDRSDLIAAGLREQRRR